MPEWERESPALVRRRNVIGPLWRLGSARSWPPILSSSCSFEASFLLAYNHPRDPPLPRPHRLRYLRYRTLPPPPVFPSLRPTGKQPFLPRSRSPSLVCRPRFPLNHASHPRKSTTPPPTITRSRPCLFALLLHLLRLCKSHRTHTYILCPARPLPHDPHHKVRNRTRSWEKAPLHGAQ